MRSNKYIDIMCDDCHELLERVVIQVGASIKDWLKHYGWTSKGDCDFCPKCTRKRAKLRAGK